VPGERHRKLGDVLELRFRRRAGHRHRQNRHKPSQPLLLVLAMYTRDLT
jgi:hypothetical protein